MHEAGFTKIAPADGAFYIYSDVSDLTNDSEHFCHKILEDTGVAITPGIDFDQGRGNAFVRLSFSGSTQIIREASDRLKDWMSKQGKR